MQTPLKSGLWSGLVLLLMACNPSQPTKDTAMQDFIFQTEQFADIRILRYQIPGFESLSLQQKELLYYLYEAAQAGRDIIWDQNYKHNLLIRKTLEQIILHYNGNREHTSFKAFETYCKQIWVANGIHHHYSTEKILPSFSPDYLITLVNNAPDAQFPIQGDETPNDLLRMLIPMLFDPHYDGKRVNLDPQVDIARESANNFYEGVSQQEVQHFYESLTNSLHPQAPSYGLNSKLMQVNGRLEERVWKRGGMYTQAIEQILFWLQKAARVAENDSQKAVIKKLMAFYESGDLATFDAYSILWVADTASEIDFTNGFIEVYGDPFGLKGSFQAMVSITDHEASLRTAIIASQAQWFEDHLPIHYEYKKEEALGISARAIHAVTFSGDNSPTPPLGVNLPNSEWIRRDHGSKSVTLSNISDAYNEASKQSGVLEEFSFSETEIQMARQYGALASDLHTDLHEIIGHGSGKLQTGVADMGITLKNYASVIEETRADLIGLYYIMDPKMLELGLVPNTDVGRTQYNQYIKNSLMLQLYRIKPGNNLEQAHMRNRQLIASWVYEKGLQDKVIERTQKNGKTYFVIQDYEALQKLFGELLYEVQRIKSEGDYDAARTLVENYGVRVDQAMLKEVHQRYNALNIPPYSAFINPVLVPVYKNKRLIDVKVEYPMDFMQQMMHYGMHYSHLPVIN